MKTLPFPVRLENVYRAWQFSCNYVYCSLQNTKESDLVHLSNLSFKFSSISKKKKSYYNGLQYFRNFTFFTFKHKNQYNSDI